jgi:hypothetical protein
MPVIKASEPLPQRSVVIGLYGEPGVSKTTLGNTAENPLVIDFDRGIARSIFRKDFLQVNSWEDIIAEEQRGTFKEYKTIIIDTAKAALDDFLMAYAVKKDFKNQKNKLQAYGAIGDEFKMFLNNRRNENSDVIIIAHAKKDEDTKKQIPDITGQSYSLVTRVCDQIGYVSMQNNQRTIQWDPTDTTIGKNTANLPVTVIPDKASEAIRSFMSGIIENVKASIVQQSEAQREALDKLERFEKEIKKAITPDELTMVVPPVRALPKALSQPLLQKIGEKAKENKWTWNKLQEKWEDPEEEKKNNGTVKEPEKISEELFQ